MIHSFWRKDYSIPRKKKLQQRVLRVRKEQFSQELEGGIYTQSDNASLIRHYDVEFGFYDLLRPFFQCQQRKQQIVHVK